MLDELKKLIADAEKEEWDLDEFNEEFEEIAQAYLQAKYTEYSGLQEHEDQAQKELDKISHLKNLVKDYEHDEKFPAFRINQQAAADKQVPTKQLHGIGFIYDHDKDDRVLVAIEKMIAMEMAGLQVIDYDLAFDIKSDLLSKQIISSDYDSNIIAVAEYKGSIAVFIKELPKADGIVRLSCYEREIEVCGDHLLTVAYNETDVFYTRIHTFIHDFGNDWLVSYRKHLFCDGLCPRKKPCSKPCYR